MRVSARSAGWDFFIFYTQVDRAWAEWIAWMLEDDGHRVLIQAWDFVPGSNWIHGMQTGMRDATRTIAVMSVRTRSRYTAVPSGRWYATADGNGAWIVSTHPARLFTRPDGRDPSRVPGELGQLPGRSRLQQCGAVMTSLGYEASLRTECRGHGGGGPWYWRLHRNW
jgi:hypothetical protein